MIIDGINFQELESERYWSWPKTYKGNTKAETKNMILSGNYMASLKNDGHYFRFIKDMNGNMRLQGRTKGVNGDFLDKLDHVPHLIPFFESLPNGTCLLGEIYLPAQRGSKYITTIMGCLTEKAIERQQAGDMLHYYIFDVYAWNGKSLLNTAFETRINKYLNSIYVNNFPYIELATYYEGQEAWDKLEEYLNAGLEGMVATRKDAKVEPGKKTARKTLKIKMSLTDTIDAFYDGNYKSATMLYTGKNPVEWRYWYNTKTQEKTTQNHYVDYITGHIWIPITLDFYNGWAGSISFSVMKDGKPYHIGYISGITQEVKNGVVFNPKAWIGRCAEINAMELERTKDGGYSLRHASIVQWRDDKKPQDCDFSQIE